MLNKIIHSWQADPDIQKLIQDLQMDASSRKHHTWNHNELRRKGRLVVGKDLTLRTNLLQWIHVDPTSGHLGREATLKRLKSVVYWRGMTKDVRIFVLDCEVC